MTRAVERRTFKVTASLAKSHPSKTATMGLT
jgi:hypothetical protein